MYQAAGLAQLPKMPTMQATVAQPLHGDRATGQVRERRAPDARHARSHASRSTVTSMRWSRLPW